LWLKNNRLYDIFRTVMGPRRLIYYLGLFIFLAGFTACQVGEVTLENPAWGTCWVADADGGSVTKIAPACDDISALNVEMGAPTAVLADPYNDVCWVADGDGQVFVLSNRAVVQKTLYGFEDPTALAFFPKEESVWILDAGLKRVTKVNAEGAVEFEYRALTAPGALACDPVTGDAYVVDGDSIVRIDREGNLLAEFTGFSSPSDIAFDSNTESLWVCDTGNNRLVKVDRDGATKLVFTDPGFRAPTLVTVNVENGVVYAVDGLEGYIVKINANAELLLYDSGEYDPADIVVNNNDDSVWVADNKNRRIVKLDADLEYINHMGGFFNPVALSPMARPR
jgi:DNA-binding beta-propeller fold protein YncE